MLHLLIGEDISSDFPTEEFDKLHFDHLPQEYELVRKDDEERGKISKVEDAL
jgi:hypothetical protein